MNYYPCVPGYTITVPVIMKKMNIRKRKQEDMDVQRIDLFMVSLVSQVNKIARHVRHIMIIIRESMRFAP